MDWTDALKEVRPITDDPTIKTTNELATIWGMSTRQAERYLRELVRRGIAEKTVKVFEDITGRVQTGVGWRLIDVVP